MKIYFVLTFRRMSCRNPSTSFLYVTRSPEVALYVLGSDGFSCKMLENSVTRFLTDLGMKQKKFTH